MEIPNNKSQITNKSQSPKLKITNLCIFPEKKNFKLVWVIKYWNLEFICHLVLGISTLGLRISDF
jgi:hypothetical protein